MALAAVLSVTILVSFKPTWAQLQQVTGGQAPGGMPVAGSTSSSSEEAATPSLTTTTSETGTSPFFRSIPEGKATGTVLPLSFKEAIDRALRNNLGLLLESDASLAARGAKWRELSHLLPNLSASANQTVEQIDLAAFGLRFHSPGIPTVIGPVGIFDARAYLTAPLFDWHAIERTRGSKANESAAHYRYRDARELVVLATGNAYLLTIAASARVDAAQAQVETAQALYNKAHDQQSAGLLPLIDALRAQVELAARRQQLIVARNNFAKQKLELARTVGLPPGQEFNLTDQAPYSPLAPMGVDEALRRAYASRSDYQAAIAAVRAAERFRRAATAEHLPSLDFAGNYGAAGVNAAESHGVFAAGATLSIPIFSGGRAHADTLEAEASLRQTRQQLQDLRGQIDSEVRTALLDLTAAAEQVEVARAALGLANQTLEQAHDRFSAGVADNLEVIQAQEAVATANENYISGLYAHNLAKVSLARVIGFAEQGVRQYLGSK